MMGACRYRKLADCLNRVHGTRNRTGTDLDHETCHTRRTRARNNLGKQKQRDQPVKALCCKGGLGTAQPRRFGRNPGKGDAEGYQDLTCSLTRSREVCFIYTELSKMLRMPKN